MLLCVGVGIIGDVNNNLLLSVPAQMYEETHFSDL